LDSGSLDLEPSALAKEQSCHPYLVMLKQTLANKQTHQKLIQEKQLIENVNKKEVV